MLRAAWHYITFVHYITYSVADSITTSHITSVSVARDPDLAVPWCTQRPISVYFVRRLARLASVGLIDVREIACAYTASHHALMGSNVITYSASPTFSVALEEHMHIVGGDNDNVCGQCLRVVVVLFRTTVPCFASPPIYDTPMIPY